MFTGLDLQPLTIPGNRHGTDYFVGDIHGHIQLLRHGLRDIGFNPSIDRLFCTGDLVDRGPNSLDCLRLLRTPWMYAVIGNHEYDLLEFLNGCEQLSIGGLESHWQRKLSSEERVEAGSLLRMLSPCITIEGNKKVGVIHAAVPSTLSWDQTAKKLAEGDQLVLKTCINDRSIMKEDRLCARVDYVFIGHQIVDCPKQKGNYVLIDTGCYIPRRYGAGHGLTFAHFEGEKIVFHTVPSPY